MSSNKKLLCCAPFLCSAVASIAVGATCGAAVYAMSSTPNLSGLSNEESTIMWRRHVAFPPFIGLLASSLSFILVYPAATYFADKHANKPKTDIEPEFITPMWETKHK